MLNLAKIPVTRLRSESKAELPKERRLVMKGIHEADLTACSEPQHVVEEKKEKELGFVMMGFHILNRGEDDQPSSVRIANLGFSTNLADEGKVDVWTLDAVLRGQTPTPVTPAIYEAITSGFLTPDIPPPPGAQPPPLEYPEINQQK